VSSGSLRVAFGDSLFLKRGLGEILGESKGVNMESLRERVETPEACPPSPPQVE
jgi:hypothetical protein